MKGSASDGSPVRATFMLGYVWHLMLFEHFHENARDLPQQRDHSVRSTFDDEFTWMYEHSFARADRRVGRAGGCTSAVELTACLT